jgi:hypothetical protein
VSVVRVKLQVNSVTIPRGVDEVFDFLSDLANERSWNPDLVSVEAPGNGPITPGTRYLCQWKGGPPVECVYKIVERPRRWEIYGTAKGMDIDLAADVEPAGDGAHLTVTMTLLLRGLLGPLIRRGFQKKEAKNMVSIRAALKEGTPR